MAGKDDEEGKNGFWASLDKDGDGMVIDDILDRMGGAFRMHRIHKRDIEDQWDDVVNNTLASIRTLMPGVSIILGFLLSIIFSTTFQTLALEDQLLLFLAFYLAAMTLSLLLTPGIYYRIVYPFEDKEVFINFANKVLIVAMFPLATCIMLLVFVATKVALPDGFEYKNIMATVFVYTILVFFFTVWLKALVDRKKFYILRRKGEREEREAEERKKKEGETGKEG